MKNTSFSSLAIGLGAILLLPLFAFTTLTSNNNSNDMKNKENLGLYVILHAKPEKAADVKQFLMGGYELAQKEAGTVSWYAFQVDETTFGIFDTFSDEAGRDAHLTGDIAKALLANADDLLVDFQVTDIKKHNILAAK